MIRGARPSETPCPMCQSTDDMAALYDNGRGHIVYRCRTCDVLMVDSPRKVELLFDEHYYDADMEAFYRSKRAEFGETARDYLRAVEQTNGPVAGRSLLDVGAGLGYFLDVAADAGAHVTGLDIREAAVRFVRAQGHASHHALVHDHAASSPERYDIVTAWNVIEHDDEPRRFAAAAFRLLRPGGVFVLETPDNFHGIKQAAYLYFAAVPPRLRPLLPNLHTDTGHRCGFSVASLTGLLESVGFGRVSSAPSPYDGRLMLQKIASRAPTRVHRAAVTGLLAPGFALMKALGVSNRFTCAGFKL